MTYVVAALYKFAPLTELASLKAALEALCESAGLCGTLLLAEEGVNGTVAGTRSGIDTLLARLSAVPGLESPEYKESFAEAQPFHRMKVRLKKEIVTLGIPEADPNVAAGVYVDSAEWNALISDPDTLVLDTRNDYEVKIGTFANAADPGTASFRDFPAYVEKNLRDQKRRKVAMFCTGGIRCEKASAYMKRAGFENVFHLKGGILKYLETVPEEKSLWRGECFVFDQRVAVTHGLKSGTHVLCPSCRRPVGIAGRESEKYVAGVSCPACHDVLPDSRRARSAERHRQVLLAERRGERHIGARYRGEGE